VATDPAAVRRPAGGLRNDPGGIDVLGPLEVLDLRQGGRAEVAVDADREASPGPTAAGVEAARDGWSSRGARCEHRAGTGRLEPLFCAVH
jgi:hypothetical protein